jgi:hypothetical protein
MWEAWRRVQAGAIGEVRAINLYESTAEISGGGCQGLSVARLFAADSPAASATGWVAVDLGLYPIVTLHYI